MASQSTEKKNLMTYEGLKELENELEERRTVLRKEISQKIKEAREQGDLSENAEYDAAMDEQRDNEARIEEIQKILKNAEVVDEEEVSTDAVGIGCRVTVFDMEFDEELEIFVNRGKMKACFVDQDELKNLLWMLFREQEKICDYDS